MPMTTTAGAALRLCLLVGLVAFAAASARAATLDQILQAGEIRVGVNPTLPPRAFYNDTLRNTLNVALSGMPRSGDVERMSEKWAGRSMDTEVPATPWF